MNAFSTLAENLKRYEIIEYFSLFIQRKQQQQSISPKFLWPVMHLQQISQGQPHT